MLAEVLDSFALGREFWADFLGTSPRQLEEWASGSRQMPTSFRRKLATLLGISQESLSGPAIGSVRASRLVPPLWLKLREQDLGEKGFHAVAAARLLASHYEEVMRLCGALSETFRGRFQEIRNNVDPQAPAEVQGLLGAETFLAITQLGNGGRGIGEVLRGHLRAMGLLILETPLSHTNLEGFCIPVSGGDERASSRPCLLANSYKTTWFRRNYVLLHELAHAIFDLDASAAMFDSSIDAAPEAAVATQLAEVRADSFARHTLVPRRLLVSLENSGFRFRQLTPNTLAEAVAFTHVEKKLLVRMAREYDLIDDSDEDRLNDLDCAAELKAVSYHARGLASVERGQLIHEEIRDWGDRRTTFPVAGLRLPVQLVRSTLEALKERRISASKAAELLMISPDELTSRFRVSIPEPAAA